MCVCMCVRCVHAGVLCVLCVFDFYSSFCNRSVVCFLERSRPPHTQHTHTHTHIRIYIHMHTQYTHNTHNTHTHTYHTYHTHTLSLRFLHSLSVSLFLSL